MTRLQQRAMLRRQGRLRRVRRAQKAAFRLRIPLIGYRGKRKTFRILEERKTFDHAFRGMARANPMPRGTTTRESEHIRMFRFKLFRNRGLAARMQSGDW